MITNAMMQLSVSPYLAIGIQAAQFLMSAAGLVILWNIATHIGAWSQWRKWAEEQLKALGNMTREQGEKIAEIIGRLKNGRG